MGIGAIIIDSQGKVCSALATRVHGNLGAFLGQCMALREDLNLAIVKG